MLSAGSKPFCVLQSVFGFGLDQFKVIVFLCTIMITKAIVLLIALGGVCRGQNTTTAGTISLPTGKDLDKIIADSFKNIDVDKNSQVERWEFDSFIIAADTNDDGCMDLTEYQGFSAGGTAIATKIFKYFDPTNSNCITVDKVYDQFTKMDANDDGSVNIQEFEQYYVQLLNTLFGQQPGPVG